MAQAGSRDDLQVQQLKQLSEAERWEEMVRLAEGVPALSAEVEYYYGTALAHLGRWSAAREVFQAGTRLQPRDKRFPLELAGVAFKTMNYSQAAGYLQRALQLDPQDSYANDFLGSVYFLEDNLEAALKYWNRVGKPQIEQVRSDPEPRVDPALLDRAFLFSPASLLRASELNATGMRLDGVGIFPSYRFGLDARDDGKFDVTFHNQERNGWGRNKWEGLFLLFRGLPFQSVNPGFYNLRREALNFVSLYRWDAEKRRVFADLSGPIRRNPKWRYHVGTDWRSENWDIRTSFTGPSQLLGGLNLRREAVSAEIDSFPGGRWNWSTGLEVSHRDFRSVFSGTALTPELLAKGYQLKQGARVDANLWRIPENRFSLSGEVSSQTGRIWSVPEDSFLKLQSALHLKWFPLPEGDDYEMQQHTRAGKTFGDVPFDELFMLGLERDNDLPMRAHIGTRNGRKGSAPLGRNYFLASWEVDKNVYRQGPLTVKLGPFVDTGKITDPSPRLGSHEWLCDLGVQAKPSVFGLTVVFSYGKDLRSGNNAFYLTLGR
jgi:tetratricopeptide (TPR) repeat protein